MVIGHLNTSSDSGNNWITFKDAKHQVRASLRASNITTSSFFRARSANKGELSIQVPGGVVTAKRKPGAPITFSEVTFKTAEDMTQEEINKIEAGG